MRNRRGFPHAGSLWHVWACTHEAFKLSFYFFFLLQCLVSVCLLFLAEHAPGFWKNIYSMTVPMYLFSSQPFKIISFHFSAYKADFGLAPEIGKLPMQQFRMRESPRTLLDADKFKILLWLVKCYLIHVISECAPCSKSKFPSREKKNYFERGLAAFHDYRAVKKLFAPHVYFVS